MLLQKILFYKKEGEEMKISWIKKSVCALLLSLNQIAFNIGNETSAIFVNNGLREI